MTITHTTHDWREVSRDAPCPACGKTSWCARTIDADLARCMREGATPAGYRHVRENADGGRLYGRIAPAPAPRPRRPAMTKPAPARDWAALHAEARARIEPGEVADFANVELGLAGEGVDALDVGIVGNRYAFPERDETGAVIGLVKRTIEGKKIALPGSRRGLTYRPPLSGPDPVLVVEGASDAAAAMEAGFTAVGRPSSSGGGAMLAKLLRGRAVVIVAENDEKADGSWPGRDGAERIAKQLAGACRSVHIIFPPAGRKDLRDWIGGSL